MFSDQDKKELAEEAQAVRESHRRPAKKPKLFLVTWNQGDEKVVKVCTGEQDAFLQYAAAYASGLGPECFESVKIELELTAKRK